MDTKAKKPQRRSAPQSGGTAQRKKTTGSPQARKNQPSGRPVAVKSKARRAAAPKKPTPEVVYTQPGPFNRNRFLLHIATVVAVVLALLFGMSIFFKVKTVTVAGNNKYTAWDVKEASGVQEGENLLTISEPKLSSNIKSRLPYVNKVRIGIKLPDTVRIEIEELDVVYAIESDDGGWWLMRSDGVIVEKSNSADAEQHTKIVGVKIAAGEVGQMATAASTPAETVEGAEASPVTVLPSEQLSTVVTVLQYLESNRIIGEIASLNVEDLSNIELWYADRFQVLLGDTTQLSYKIGLIKTTIDDHMQTYDRGVLDASLTIQPDPEKEYHVIYTPFNG